MRYLNKEQIEQLKNAEPYFNTVIHEQWKRNTTRQLNELVADIYEEVSGNKVNRQWGCSKCIYDLYLMAGRLYFESISVQKELEPTTDNQVVNIEQSQISQEKKNKITKRNKSK